MSDDKAPRVLPFAPKKQPKPVIVPPPKPHGALKITVTVTRGQDVQDDPDEQA